MSSTLFKKTKQIRKYQKKVAYARYLRRKQTRAEKLLWPLILIGYKRQVVVHGYIVDFAFLSIKLALEVDGSIHLAKRAADRRRTKHLRQKYGWYVVRVKNETVYKHRIGVLVGLYLFTAWYVLWTAIKIAFMFDN